MARIYSDRRTSVHQEHTPGLGARRALAARVTRATRMTLAALTVLAAPATLTAQAAGPAADSLVLEPCELPGVPPPAACGELEVWEDREAEEGRRITLRVVRLEATGPQTRPDPLFPILGGPGQSVVESAAGLAAGFTEVRRERDIVLVDQRGTGGSNPLDCSLFGPAENAQAFLVAFLPEESVQRCRSVLEERADLRLYGTHLAADDLDEVRRALGYERINLFGISYGTRATLTYLRRHGAHARAAVLVGVYPPGLHGPALFAPAAQRALDGVLQECLAEPGCRGTFPDIRDAAKRVFERLAQEPTRAEVVHPVTGRRQDVRLNRDLAAEAVRYMLYGPGTAGLVPAVLHQADQGDLAPLAEFAVLGRLQVVDSGYNGLYLSITCAEEVAPVDPEEAARLADETFLGEYRYRDQAAACRHWPLGAVPEDVHEPVRTNVPVLLLSGAWDPVTPPSHAERAVAHLPRGRHLVVPHGGHGFDGLEGGDECADRLVAEFLRQASAEELEVDCLERVRRRPFRTDPLPMEVVEADPAVLEAAEGTYEPAGPAAALPSVRLEAVEGGVRVVLPGGQALLHVPVGGDRFRAVGLLGFYLELQREDGEVVGLRVSQPAGEAFVLRRADPAPEP